MKITIALFSVSLFSFSNLLAHDFKHSPGFPAPPSGLKTPGDSHGEIAVASNGEIHVSVQSGKKAGIQVYSPEGKYLRNVKGAPHDFHGFVIHKEKSGEFIYGVGLNTGSLTKMTLDGTIVFQTPVSAIPEKFIGKKKELLSPRFTSCDVAPDGTIIVTDGYGTDNLHLYNADGSYRMTWIGRKAPYLFKNLHKVFIDLRYDQPRILCCDRANKRLVHLSMDGKFIGEYATGLRRPSSAAFHGDHVAIAEIEGRISVLDKEGTTVATMGTNDDKYNGNRTPPEQWREGVVTSPHGISYDLKGNIIMSEYSKFGRILKYSLKAEK